MISCIPLYTIFQNGRYFSILLGPLMPRSFKIFFWILEWGVVRLLRNKSCNIVAERPKEWMICTMGLSYSWFQLSTRLGDPPGSDRIRPDRTGSTGQIGSDWTGSNRIGSDWQTLDWINNKIIVKSRRSPDNVLKRVEVEFCAFLSCVVVSSFIESHWKGFFPEVITDSEASLWKIRCLKFSLAAMKIVIILGMQRWRSGESTRLPPMWLEFDSQTWRHMWVEFVGSLLCSGRFFSGYSGFPLYSQKSTFYLICINC